MHLSDGLACVRLSPLRFEFPERDETEWNWLVVRGVVSVSDTSWSFEDALLTPREGLLLADWLEQLDPHSDGGSFGFMEPEVRFERRANLDEEHVVLDVFFDYEAAPPWLGTEDGGGYVVRLRIDRERCRSAARDLRLEIRAVAGPPPVG